MLPDRGVRRGRRLPNVQVSRLDLVRTILCPYAVSIDALLAELREKGDASKARDYLPADKQYLLTRGVPCLRRASTLAYTDADEDAERLLSFADPGSKDGGGKEEEWVETHAGRAASHDAGAHVGTIDDIPDVDDVDGSGAMGGLSLGGGGRGEPAEIPDMDEIPDMEEDLEEGEDEATAAPKTVTPSSGAAETG